MRTAIAIAALTLVGYAQQIDRIVATVNNRPVTESEWEQQERFEAMTNNEPWTGFQHSQASLERLIDRALILQQMDSAAIPKADDAFVAAQLISLRKQMKLESDNDWKARLTQYGLLEPDVADVVSEQANVLRFIDARFRPAVHIPIEDVRRYYRETYLPQFRRTAKSGGAPPPLAEVESQIIGILTEQRLNDLFTTWLKTLRAQANVKRFRLEPGK
jgi:hypothetical protein